MKNATNWRHFINSSPSLKLFNASRGETNRICCEYKELALDEAKYTLYSECLVSKKKKRKAYGINEHALCDITKGDQVSNNIQ